MNETRVRFVWFRILFEFARKWIPVDIMKPWSILHSGGTMMKQFKYHVIHGEHVEILHGLELQQERTEFFDK